MPSRRSAERCARSRRRRAGGRRCPRPGQQGERGQHVQGVPLGAERQPEAAVRPRSATAGRSTPDRTGRARSGRSCVSRWSASRLRNQSRSAARQATAATTKKARKMSSSAVRDITNASPSKASSSPARPPIRVDRETRRTSRIVHQDQQRAEDQRSDPPAEGVHPEELLARRDQPLADRRVDDERRGVLHHVGVAGDDLGVGVVGPVPLVAELQQRVRVLGVVGLVEDQLVGRPRCTTPQHEGDGGDRRG